MNAIPTVTTQDWQSLLSSAISSLPELLTRLELPATLAEQGATASQEFSLRVPEPYLARIEKGNPSDPLLLQVLPQAQEMLNLPGFTEDPLAEMASNPLPGVIHKYRGRVLLIMTGACAINCRYCFRRHFPYQDNQLSSAQWQQVLDYLRDDTSISEVIFSGGDPLATPDKRFARFVSDLETIPHLQRLRIHSRLPVVIPQRITQTFIDTLASSRLHSVLVIHSNHANEIDSSTGNALKKLQQAGIIVLNQAVLLKGINDTLPAQKALHETLFRYGVLPYYLFVLDKVQGAAHFDVDDTAATALIKALQAELPGYLIPRLAREIPGRPSKTLLSLD